MANCREVSKTAQLGYSAIGAAIFFLLSQPFMYKLTNSVFGGKPVFVTLTDGPSTLGILVHAVVFMLIIFLIMQPWKKAQYMCDEKC
jgi:hypothetical protein